MNSVPELIQAIEAAGGRFMVDGDRLGIVPSSTAAPVMEELRQHKPEIIELLSSRPAMPAGVRLIRWAPKAAPVQLSRFSTVTVVDLFIRTTLMQVEARLSGKGWLDGGWTLSGLLARLEACGCIVALDDPREALQ
jgi:hypothetical protein